MLNGRTTLAASALIAVAATVLPGTPVAAAEPVWPSAGDGSAADTIAELTAQGYDVQINWVDGYSTRPLTECVVPAIHNPNRSDQPPANFTTVYVDVSCPDNSDDSDSGFGVGF